MAEEKCPKHKVLLKLRRNVKTGELLWHAHFVMRNSHPRSAR
jgi:hypothetical protein